MKKALFISIIGLTLLCSCVRESKKTDLDFYNLNGKVKSLKENNYKAEEKFGEIVKGEKEESFTPVTIFNKDGNLIESSMYNANGELEFKTIYKYNEKGYINKEITYVANGEFNTNNYHVYNEKGFLIEKNNFNAKDSLVSKSNYRYDEKGNNIEINYYKLEEIDYKIKFEYNAKGQIIESNYYDSDGSIIGKIKYLYNNKGNEEEVASTFFYTWTEEDKTKELFKYKYDEKGNWIERITFDEDNIPLKITERIIEYFD